MPAGNILQLIKTLNNAFNNQDWDHLFENVTESVLYVHPGFPEPVEGIAEVRQYFERVTTMAPNLKNEIVQIIGEGNWICVESIWTGSNTGTVEYADGRKLAPTNKSFHLPVCTLYKIENGKIAEIRVYEDLFSFRNQIGII